MLRGLFLVLRGPAPEEEPAVHFGVQGLHASAQHLRPAGEIGNVAHRDSRFAQQLGGSASGENFDLQSRQALRKFYYPSLVKHTDQRALHTHESLRNEKAQQCNGLTRFDKVESRSGQMVENNESTRECSMAIANVLSSTWRTSGGPQMAEAILRSNGGRTTFFRRRISRRFAGPSLRASHRTKGISGRK